MAISEWVKYKKSIFGLLVFVCTYSIHSQYVQLLTIELARDTDQKYHNVTYEMAMQKRAKVVKFMDSFEELNKAIGTIKEVKARAGEFDSNGKQELSSDSKEKKVSLENKLHKAIDEAKLSKAHAPFEQAISELTALISDLERKRAQVVEAMGNFEELNKAIGTIKEVKARAGEYESNVTQGLSSNSKEKKLSLENKLDKAIEEAKRSVKAMQKAQAPFEQAINEKTALIYDLEEDMKNTAFASMKNTVFGEGDLNISSIAPCGHFKCFFPLSSDPSVGYLAANNESYTGMERGYMAGQYLVENYDMRHLMLAPPELINITAKLAHHLSANNYRLVHPNAKGMNFDELIAIQKVQGAPSPHLFFGCRETKQKYWRPKWDSFMESVNQDLFLPQFRRELKSIKYMVEKDPWVTNDFQALIGTDGKFYLIDIPGQGNKHLDMVEHCAKAFQHLSYKVSGY